MQASCSKDHECSRFLPYVNEFAFAVSSGLADTFVCVSTAYTSTCRTLHIFMHNAQATLVSHEISCCAGKAPQKPLYEKLRKGLKNMEEADEKACAWLQGVLQPQQLQGQKKLSFQVCGQA